MYGGSAGIYFFVNCSETESERRSTEEDGGAPVTEISGEMERERKREWEGV